LFVTATVNNASYYLKLFYVIFRKNILAVKRCFTIFLEQKPDPVFFQIWDPDQVLGNSGVGNAPVFVNSVAEPELQGAASFGQSRSRN
jgi:hypothetical protein